MGSSVKIYINYTTRSDQEALKVLQALTIECTHTHQLQCTSIGRLKCGRSGSSSGHYTMPAS